MNRKNVHELEILPNYFEDVKSGIKQFEISFNDKKFKVGDCVILKEYDDYREFFTGRKIRVKITYLLTYSEAGQFGLMAGHCIFGFRILK